MIHPVHERLNMLAMVEDYLSLRTTLCKITGTQKSVGTQRNLHVARLTETGTKMSVAQPDTDRILHEQCTCGERGKDGFRSMCKVNGSVIEFCCALLWVDELAVKAASACKLPHTCAVKCLDVFQMPP